MLLTHHPLFAVGMLLIVGYIMGKLVKLIKLPEITGFIFAGIIMGESILGLIPHHMNPVLTNITNTALGLIAFTIGGEFYFVKLKKLGKNIVIITFIQLMATFFIVSLSMYLFKMELPFALLLGAIASATAPAATVALVQSLRAYGSFIDYLYGVVALDDAGCVIIFAIIFAYVNNTLSPLSVDVSSTYLILHAFGEIIFSLIIGAIFGGLVHFFTIKKSNSNEILITTFAFILLNTSISLVFNLSHLLSNMALGAVLINLSAQNHRIFRNLERLAPLIFALFFVIAGTELNPNIIFNRKILLLGSVYIFSRIIGKYFGVYAGCKISKTSDKITKYLGYCMFPQAGVALGLVFLVQASPIMNTLSSANLILIDNMVNIILLSVFVNEIIGPPISKFAIIKGNDME